MSKMRPPIKRHGGKSYLAARLIALFPPHRVYVEPFVGGGSVLLNKPKAEQEIAGDAEQALIHFWRTLRGDDAEAFIADLDFVPYAERTFREVGAWEESVSPILRASAFLIRNRMSRGGFGKDYAWSDRLRGGQPEQLNSWDTIRRALPAISGRIKDVRFLAQPAIETILEFAASDALVYADPPYVHATRTARTAYEHEMTDADHEDLILALNTRDVMAAVSGYRCDLYDTLLRDWTRHDFDMPNHSGQGKTKQRRIESAWVKT